MPATAVPLRLRSVLICHTGSVLDVEGLSRWLHSFSELAGIVILDEPRRRTWQRVRAQLRRAGPLRMIDVLAFRAWYAMRHAEADRRFALRDRILATRG